MTDSGSSLIQAQAEHDASAPAFSFFSDVQREAEERLEQAGEFTGERLFRDRPAIYAAVVRMQAEGQSISATARALGVSRNTVCAVRDREGISIEHDKKELLRDLRRAGRLSVEKVIELLPDVKSAKDAAITAAVMLDKQQLLSGEPTSRVERVEARPDQVKAFLDSLPVVDAELIEVVSTGIEPETPGQRAATAAQAAVALGHSSEIASDDMPAAISYEVVVGTTSRATPIENPPHPRGGGGSASDTHAPGWIDPEKQNFDQRADEAVETLCKRTLKKKPGASPKARITKKKKGGSAC